MYWQIAGLIISVVQMGLYLNGLDKYENKLQDLAAWLCDNADLNATCYIDFKDSDLSFYDYYCGLPDYAVCMSNVNRSKGAAFYGYGSKMRRSIHAGRGYTPMVKVHLNAMVSSDAVAASATNRAIAIMKERDRVNAHVLERWSAIVSAPIDVEGYQAAPVGAIISQSFKSLKAYGRGFNSAGAAFGSTLYKVLN